MDCKVNENEIGKRKSQRHKQDRKRETTHNQDVECVRKIVSCYNTVRVLKYGFVVSG